MVFLDFYKAIKPNFHWLDFLNQALDLRSDDPALKERALRFFRSGDSPEPNPAGDLKGPAGSGSI